MSNNFKLVTLGAVLSLCLGFGRGQAADEKPTLKPLPVGKIEATDCKGEIGEPHYGYTGLGGSFMISGKKGHALMAIHSHPDYTKMRMGHTELEYVGTKNLNGVDGWVFKTSWDGKTAPKELFFSAREVYFGLGVRGHIIADHREATTWSWKLEPMSQYSIYD